MHSGIEVVEAAWKELQKCISLCDSQDWGHGVKALHEESGNSILPVADDGHETHWLRLLQTAHKICEACAYIDKHANHSTPSADSSLIDRAANNDTITTTAGTAAPELVAIKESYENLVSHPAKCLGFGTPFMGRLQSKLQKLILDIENHVTQAAHAYDYASGGSSIPPIPTSFASANLEYVKGVTEQERVVLLKKILSHNSLTRSESGNRSASCYGTGEFVGHSADGSIGHTQREYDNCDSDSDIDDDDDDQEYDTEDKKDGKSAPSKPYTISHARTGNDVLINTQALKDALCLSGLESHHISRLGSSGNNNTTEAQALSGHKAVIAQLTLLKDILGESTSTSASGNTHIGKDKGTLELVSSDGRGLKRLCAAVVDLRLDVLNERYNLCLPVLEIIPKLHQSLQRCVSDCSIVDFEDISMFVLIISKKRALTHGIMCLSFPPVVGWSDNFANSHTDAIRLGCVEDIEATLPAERDAAEGAVMNSMNTKNSDMKTKNSDMNTKKIKASKRFSILADVEMEYVNAGDSCLYVLSLNDLPLIDVLEEQNLSLTGIGKERWNAKKIKSKAEKDAILQAQRVFRSPLVKTLHSVASLVAGISTAIRADRWAEGEGEDFKTFQSPTKAEGRVNGGIDNAENFDIFSTVHPAFNALQQRYKSPSSTVAEALPMLVDLLSQAESALKLTPSYVLENDKAYLDPAVRAYVHQSVVTSLRDELQYRSLQMACFRTFREVRITGM